MELYLYYDIIGFPEDGIINHPHILVIPQHQPITRLALHHTLYGFNAKGFHNLNATYRYRFFNRMLKGVIGRLPGFKFYRHTQN